MESFGSKGVSRWREDNTSNWARLLRGESPHIDDPSEKKLSKKTEGAAQETPINAVK